MEMGALKAYSLRRAAVQSAAAGVDTLLVCHTRALQLAAVDAVAGAAARGELPRARLVEAARRLDRCCARFCAPAPPSTRVAAPPADPATLVGTAAHRALIGDALKARL